MMKHLRYMAVAALAAVGTACSEGPTDSNQEFDGELVITEGVGAPEYVARVRPVFSAAAASASLGGGSTTPLSLKPASCEPLGQTLTVTYVVTGRQENPASFKVYSRWSYDGASWTGSMPVTVNVATRPTGPGSDSYPVQVTVVNPSSVGSGTSTFSIVPFDLVTSAPAALGVAGANVTIFVAFSACEITNTAPTLFLPTGFSVEATSSEGAVVDYAALVTASDAEDGDITGSVICAPASGTVFALGTTTVECSVTDAGGLQATGSFDIAVEDTTPAYFTSFPAATINLIATNINGAVLDIDALNITVEDVGNVSEPSTFTCDYVAGTVLAIGSLTDVDCTAKDAIGNESGIHTFQVFVGLNVSGTGFLPPLRMAAPFSAHKKGSTIPHKFLPPTYADGTPAIDLADGLNLAIRHLDWQPEEDAIQVNDYSAGSTEWRYDPESGHYIFNLKTQSVWATGSWNTTVSFAGIPLASTQFDLKK
jgi:hypothetical protein